MVFCFFTFFENLLGSDKVKEPYWWKFILEGLRVAEHLQPWLDGAAATVVEGPGA